MSQSKVGVVGSPTQVDVLNAQVEILATPTDVEEAQIVQRALESAVALTGSEVGQALFTHPAVGSAQSVACTPDGATGFDDRVWKAVLDARAPLTLDGLALDQSDCLGVPVIHDDKVQLVFALAGSGSYQDDHAAMAKSVAECAWQVIQRQRELQSLRDRVELLSDRQNLMGVATWQWDLLSDSVRWDSAAGTIVPGLRPDTQSWASLMSLLDERSAQDLADLLAAKQAFSLELSGQTQDGQDLRLLMQAQQRCGPDGPSQLRGTLMDVSVIAALEEAHRQATHDVLTGLPNRAWLLDGLAARLARPLNRREDQFALLFMDLDGFKAVNDEFGHLQGDTVLMTCAQRIKAVTRGKECVARFGGDEFVMILDGPFTWQSVQSLAHRLRDGVGRPQRVGSRIVQVGISIGIALCSNEHWSVQDLLREADDALLEAKKSPWGVVIRDDRGAWHA